MHNEFIAGWLMAYQASAAPVDDLSPFMAWAITLMVRELRPRLGRPDLPWLTADLLDRLRDARARGDRGQDSGEFLYAKNAI